MCLKEMGENIAGRLIDIVATEFSTQVLEKAKSGIFSQFEVQRGLPIQLLIKYFDQIGEGLISSHTRIKVIMPFVEQDARIAELDVHGAPVGARVGKSGEQRAGVVDHEVAVQEEIGMSS